SSRVAHLPSLCYIPHPRNELRFGAALFQSGTKAGFQSPRRLPARSPPDALARSGTRNRLVAQGEGTTLTREGSALTHLSTPPPPPGIAGRGKAGRNRSNAGEPAFLLFLEDGRDSWKLEPTR